ncbi:MAG: hypothetical protein DRQ37_06780 [Gammaproteobacteria bacterium]|nr:MAG: hypothetical protein DRQ37_06780 [Gammaproteobacteria bacterium]
MASRTAQTALLLPLLLLATTAEARLYQWTNPQTGSAQLSGAPPSWYRSPAGGPRILVYDQGQLIDDTAVALPSENSEILRKQAFRELEQQRQNQALKRLEQAAKREAARRKKETKKEEEVAAESTPASSAEELDSRAVEQLKGILAEWDRQNAGKEGEEKSEEPTPGKTR